jgi:hypothetical protein
MASSGAFLFLLTKKIPAAQKYDFFSQTSSKKSYFCAAGIFGF